MRLRHGLLAVLGLLACGLASAQVFRCVDGSGRATFSDQACEVSGMRGEQIQNALTPQEKNEQQALANEALIRQQLRRAQERERALEKANAQLASRSMPAPANPSQSQSLECQEARKDLDYVASIRSLSDFDKRLRLNAAIAASNAACGTSTPLMQEPARSHEGRAAGGGCYRQGAGQVCY